MMMCFQKRCWIALSIEGCSVRGGFRAQKILSVDLILASHLLAEYHDWRSHNSGLGNGHRPMIPKNESGLETGQVEKAPMANTLEKVNLSSFSWL